jgi:hypothetical protein
VINYTTSGKAQANVLNFFFAGGYAQADIDALASAVDAGVGADFLPVLAAGTNYVNTLVRGLTDPIDLTATNNTNAGAGTNPGTVENPSNVAFCVTLRTGLTGRSARGRFYALGSTQSDMAAQNLFKSAYGDAVVAFLDDLNIATALLGWRLVILSRVAAGVARPVAIHNNVTDISYRNLVVDSQRGRLPANH